MCVDVGMAAGETEVPICLPPFIRHRQTDRQRDRQVDRQVD